MKFFPRIGAVEVATQTTTLVKSDSCVCILNWDDVLLTAASCTMANVSGTTDVVFFITVSGITQFKQVNPGQTAILIFTTPLIVVNVGGIALISNLNSFGAGVQVDTSIL